MAALFKGPVASSVGSTNQFEHYKSGVVTSDCSDSPNHDILIVGLGEENGQ